MVVPLIAAVLLGAFAGPPMVAGAAAGLRDLANCCPPSAATRVVPRGEGRLWAILAARAAGGLEPI